MSTKFQPGKTKFQVPNFSLYPISNYPIFKPQQHPPAQKRAQKPLPEIDLIKANFPRFEKSRFYIYTKKRIARKKFFLKNLKKGLDIRFTMCYYNAIARATGPQQKPTLKGVITMLNPICTCKGCTSPATVKVDLYRRGGRSAWLCDFHAHSMESYYFENDHRHGTNKVNPYTYGIELETAFSTVKARVELAAMGFIPTSDCTVDVEYKSPIFNGMNALSKQALTIERLMDEDELKIDDSCGTHTHVGNRDMINAETMQYIRRFYHSLFLALSNEMRACPAETRKLFGRDFGHWASPIYEYTSPTEHTNFINTQHDNTLEFRLVFFRTAKQYMAAVKFARACTEAVCNNFLAHFNDTPTDTKRYPTVTEYRKHKATVAAKKMVKYFHEFAAQA